MIKFEQAFEAYMNEHIQAETNGRRKERLERGLGHAEMVFLKTVWYPIVGHFQDLHPEWEVRDFANGYRYIDFAYMPSAARGAIEIQGYGSHARDLELWWFKDLCLRHCHLTLDGWSVLPIAYPSIIEVPKQCQQLVLALIGKFVSTSVPASLTWLEAEAVRYGRRTIRPFTAAELSAHLRISCRHARHVPYQLYIKQLLSVASGTVRARTYQIVHEPTSSAM
ncbi:transcriptional regulator [Paenibacillus whitsoniae]|uniref:Transcriptional regulator n=2 Tax=Paenibacillus whitsoniae TaxID=2496558 RepID=A0A3S0C542_9BACL|nr:transcriptional regulator [Paenibacillus whitsoniae]RTE03060.1 transcriptional regulator [Paenibacillus whitsoniae]